MPARKHPLQLLAEWFQVLEVDFTAAMYLDGDLVQVFAGCKARAKINFKRLALQYHPDRGGDAEHFKAITEAWNRLKVIEVKRRPRPVPFTMVHVQVFTGYTTTATDTSTTVSFT